MRAGDDRDLPALVEMSADRSSGARFALDRAEDLIKFGLAKRRLLAGLGPPGLRETESLIPASESIAHLAARLPLAAVTGRPRRDAIAFLERAGIARHFATLVCREDAPALKPEQLRQIGIRSVDPGEKKLVHEFKLDIYDMRYIDEMGMRQTMEEALSGIDRSTHLHVSFDVDFLDPDIAPGVGTTVAGGPSYRESQLCMEMIADTGALGSVDVMELNPAFDLHNKTAEVAVDLLGSLFGKSTLMRRADG